MKKTYLRVYACVAVMTLLTIGAGGVAFADDHHHDAWSHDKDGYWDDHGSRHAFVMHENHHGYWREHNGTRVFINID